MLFVVIGIVFFFIFYISVFGNKNERELNKDIKHWEKIMGVQYYE